MRSSHVVRFHTQGEFYFVGPTHLFLQPLKLTTSNLVHSLVLGIIIFTTRCICISAVYVSMRCPSVRLSRSWVAPKRIKISLKFFHHRVATPFSFFHTKGGANIPTGKPLTGASNARGYDKMTIFSQISHFITETVIVRWAHAARQFVIIEFSFHPYNI